MPALLYLCINSATHVDIQLRLSQSTIDEMLQTAVGNEYLFIDDYSMSTREFESLSPKMNLTDCRPNNVDEH